MYQYENYYFVPCEDKDMEKYNLMVNSEGLALLIRTSKPFFVLEMQRPELVMACQEYLMKKAEQIGYAGIHKERIRIRIKGLIKELQ